VRAGNGKKNMKDLLTDLRYGLRILLKNPAFAAVAIISLALGIGANTAIFQLFDSVFLRTLPVESPEQIAEIRIQPNNDGRSGQFNGPHADLTYPQWQEIKRRQQAFSGVFAWHITRLNLAPGGEARYARGLWVSGDFFDVLGVKPLIGRIFSDADDHPACGLSSAVISYGFWKHEFGADPSVVGKTLTISGHTVDIVGVTPAEFTGLEVGDSFDVALPICSEPALDGEDNYLAKRWAWWLDVMGRLKPGWSLEQATAQLATISPGIFEATLPSIYTPEGAKRYLAFKLGAYPAGSGTSNLRESYRNSLFLLMGLAGLVLLIACANIANLLLARATSRDREIAVRLAVGASRGRLVRQLLAESLLLACLGTVFGAILGSVLSRALVAFLSTETNQVFVVFKQDWRVAAFTLAIALVTCLLFGLIPAIRSSRNSPVSAMRASGRGLTASRSHFGLRRGLVIVQVALSMVLLAGALLFSGSFRRLLTLDAGLRQTGILTASVDFTPLDIPKERRSAFKRELLDRVSGLPGVDSATEANTVPLTGSYDNDDFEVPGDSSKKVVLSDINRVSPAFFTTMGIPLLAGRDFQPNDTTGSPKVIIVNQMFAKKLLDGATPLGTTVRIITGPGQPEQIFQIVGLVRDSKYDDLHEDDLPIAYEADWQDSESGQNANVIVHTDGQPENVIAQIRMAIGEINPSIVVEFHVMRNVVLDSLLRERLLATLSGFFGALAVLLACIGLYGVLSYGVTTRTSEIGVRMALGAERRDVIWLVLKEALLLVGIGIAIGLPAIIGSIRLVSSLLYGPHPTDPRIIALGVSLLIAVAGVAAYIPAWRASKTDPMNALRHE
jgi:putative ABC transport system permease protein